MNYARPVPGHSFLTVELLHVSVEVFVKTVEVHAGCAVEIFFGFRVEFPIVSQVPQDASLAVELLFITRGNKRVIIEAIVVDTFKYQQIIYCKD